jgi:hypothetical protein
MTRDSTRTIEPRYHTRRLGNERDGCVDSNRSGHAQRFLAVYGTLQNLFVVPRHLMRAKYYRTFRARALIQYEQVTCD